MTASQPFRTSAMRHNIALIFICPSNADDELLRQIALYGRGYTYLLSRSRVTGSEKKPKFLGANYSPSYKPTMLLPHF